MSTHPALASQPEWMAWLAASDELGTRRDSLNRQILKAQADRDQIIETRNSRNAEAVRRGKPVPVFDPLPDMTHLDHALALQTADEDTHRAAREEALASAAEGALTALQQREQARWETWAGLVDQLNALIDEARDDAQLVMSLYAAEDARNGRQVHPSRASRVHSNPDVGTCLAHAVARKSLLDPEPVPPGRILVDTGPSVPRSTGYTRQGLGMQQWHAPMIATDGGAEAARLAQLAARDPR